MQHLEDPLLQAYIDGYCNDARVAEIEAHESGHFRIARILPGENWHSDFRSPLESTMR